MQPYGPPQPWPSPGPAPRKRSSKRAIVIGAVVAGVIAVAGVGVGIWYFNFKEPTTATSSACHALETAQNRVNETIFAYYQEHPDGADDTDRDEVVRSFFRTYTADVAYAADLAADSSLSADFEELRRFGNYYARGPVTTTISVTTSQVADELVTKCESIGIDMRVLDTSTGRYR